MRNAHGSVRGVRAASSIVMMRGGRERLTVIQRWKEDSEMGREGDCAHEVGRMILQRWEKEIVNVLA